MCLVIDTCAFPCVFNKHSSQHKRFLPIVEWLTSGNGKLIFGGTKYKKELRGSAFLKILIEFEKKGKIVRVDDAHVDELAKQLKVKVDDRDFDDEHIIALVLATKCCVVCTDDKRSIPFLKRKDLYPRGMRPPKIYRHAQHSALCCSDHIVTACR